jgi:hydroxymethylbilane synthase
MSLRIGTRGSDLALAQAHTIQRRLTAAGHETSIVVIQTTGDLDLTKSFADLGPAGVFAVELRAALLAHTIDIAVHSAKDIPAQIPAGLILAATTERAAPHDRLLIRPAAHDPASHGLPIIHSARLGTAAARRTALVREIRPDLQLQSLRGNVPTRIAKLLAGEHDAILLAAAGLDRLSAAAALGECDPPDYGDLILHDLDPTTFTPAPGQGTIALETRRDDPALAAAASLDDPTAACCLAAERALLAAVEAGCHTPFGAWCRHSGPTLRMSAILERDGVLYRAATEGDDPKALAATLAHQLLAGDR